MTKYPMTKRQTDGERHDMKPKSDRGNSPQPWRVRTQIPGLSLSTDPREMNLARQLASRSRRSSGATPLAFVIHSSLGTWSFVIFQSRPDRKTFRCPRRELPPPPPAQGLERPSIRARPEQPHERFLRLLGIGELLQDVLCDLARTSDVKELLAVELHQTEL